MKQLLFWLLAALAAVCGALLWRKDCAERYYRSF